MLQQLPQLRALSLFAREQSFAIDRLPLRELEVKAFGPLQDPEAWRDHPLEQLTLRECQLPGLHALLGNLIKLRSLTLEGCKLEGGPLHLPNLEELVVQGTEHAVTACFESASACKTLTCSYSALPPSLSLAKNLERLVLERPIGNSSSALASIRELTGLRELSLINSGITGDSLLETLDALRELHTVTLRGNVDVDPKLLVARLAALPRLRRLDLSRAGVKSLPLAIAQLHHLEFLDLSFNDLPSDATKWFRHAMPNTEIRIALT